MSRLYYDIDGRLGGPVTVMQLQLMASSGMLMPHHKVRKENADQWFPAQAVRGLFTPTPVAAPVAAPVAPPPVSTPAPQPEEENPFGIGAGAAPQESGINTEFDFFGGAAAAPAPTPAARPAKPAKPAPPKPKVQEPAAPPPAPAADAGNPFEFVEQPVVPRGATAPAPPVDDDLPMAEAVEEPEPPAAPAPAPPPASPPPPESPFEFPPVVDSSAATKLGESRLDPRAAKLAESKLEQKTKQPPAEEPRPAPGPTVSAEVSGQAAEVLPDRTVRLLDGKTIFKLQRAWLLVVSKFANGAVSTRYLRLSQIDAASIEQCPAADRGKSGMHSVLEFAAGNVREALVFQGGDKPYRVFIEKALLLAGAPSAATKPGQAKP